jgi:hypothetical protein
MGNSHAPLISFLRYMLARLGCCLKGHDMQPTSELCEVVHRTEFMTMFLPLDLVCTCKKCGKVVDLTSKPR